jgi:2-polyprenyl-3-methyl-5-hydroxy-6-metoxy-1,4-benzoquinol methylase
MKGPTRFLPCDICGSDNPRFLLKSARLDGPLVECGTCGFRYVGDRTLGLAFGSESPEMTAAKVCEANTEFRHLPLEEEHRLAALNAQWRLELVRAIKPSGKLLEVGCARGDFMRVAREYFEVSGVEPNGELAAVSRQIAPVHQDIIERTPWSGFDVVASFHVIEHVSSPRSFVRAAAEKLRSGGLMVIETPNIDSLPYRILKSRWRQFIPEHYFFFDRKTIVRLLSDCGLRTERVMGVGKYASLDLITNRLSRYMPWMPHTNGFSRLTFRVNPLDIMLVFATKS